MRKENGFDIVKGIVQSKRVTLPEIDEPHVLFDYEKEQIIKNTGIVKLFEEIRDSGLVTRFPGNDRKKADIIWAYENNSVMLAFNMKYERAKYVFSKRSEARSHLTFPCISLAIFPNLPSEKKLAILTGTFFINGEHRSQSVEDLLRDMVNVDFYLPEYKTDDKLEAKINYDEAYISMFRYAYRGTCTHITEQTNIPEIVGHYIAENLT